MRHDIHGHEYHGARSRGKRLVHQGSHFRRGHWDFRFCGFNSVFRFLCQKTSVFRFWHSLPLAEFPFFSIWFSVFVKNTNEFSNVEIDVVFGFS